MSKSILNPMLRGIVPATRSLLLAACVIAAPVLLNAQEPATSGAATQQQGPPPGARGAEMQQRQLDHLTKALNLTPDQVTQVKGIQDDGHQQMLALRQNSSLSQEDRHSQMRSIHEAEKGKVEAILNPDQKAKFEKMQAHMEERRAEHRGGEQAPPPPPPSN